MALWVRISIVLRKPSSVLMKLLLLSQEAFAVSNINIVNTILTYKCFKGIKLIKWNVDIGRHN